MTQFASEETTVIRDLLRRGEPVPEAWRGLDRMGGWLLWTCVLWTFLAPILLVGGLLAVATRPGSALLLGRIPLGIAAWLFLPAIVPIVYTGALVYAGVGLWLRHPGAVGAAKSVVLSMIAAPLVWYSVAEFAADQFVESAASAGVHLPGFAASMKAGFWLNAIWFQYGCLVHAAVQYTYLTHSKRVRVLYD